MSNLELSDDTTAELLMHWSVNFIPPNVPYPKLSIIQQLISEIVPKFGSVSMTFQESSNIPILEMMNKWKDLVNDR